MSLVERWRATRAGFKPRDVEELIDFYWHRPLAGLLVQLLLPTRITPNQVTVISGAFSVLTGLALGLAAWLHRGFALLAGVLLLASIVFDCADGQLARLRGTSSTVGRILDGVMDAVAPTCVFLGQAALLLAAGYGHAWVWPLGWAAALSLTWHASAYDVSKNVYLHCSRPDFSLGGATLLTPDDMRAMEQELRANDDRLGAFLMRVWVGWTAPQMRSMKPWLAPERSPQNEAERQLFLEHFRGRMQRTTWLGFGTHLFTLTLACWAATWHSAAIWLAWVIILVPLNVIALSLSLTERAAVTDYEHALRSARAASAA